MQINYFNVLTVLIFYIGFSPAHAAPTDLVGSSASSALLTGAKFDGLNDTQANKAGTEIVGDATHPSMYVNYDDNGSTTGIDSAGNDWSLSVPPGTTLGSATDSSSKVNKKYFVLTSHS